MSTSLAINLPLINLKCCTWTNINQHKPDRCTPSPAWLRNRAFLRSNLRGLRFSACGAPHPARWGAIPVPRRAPPGMAGIAPLEVGGNRWSSAWKWWSSVGLITRFYLFLFNNLVNDSKKISFLRKRMTVKPPSRNSYARHQTGCWSISARPL